MLITADLEHCLSDEDINDVIYYCKAEDASARLDTVIKEAGKLKEIVSGHLDGSEVFECPAGYVPEKSTYHATSESVRFLMNKDCCRNCPHRDECKAREQKHNYVINISKKMSERAEYVKKLSTEEYVKLAKRRNAIEGIPSVLRRRYGVDNCPHFGLIKTGWAYVLAVIAFNFVKLTKYLPTPRADSALLPVTS